MSLTLRRGAVVGADGRTSMIEYVEYLYGLGLAPSTIRMYRAMLTKALAWADEAGVDLSEPRSTELAELRREFVESAATLRQVRCALQHWWDMLEVTQPPVKALRIPKKPEPSWRGLPDDVARALAVTSVGWHPEGTVTLVGLFTGIRRSEIAAMRWDRFSADFAWYTVTGKGGVTRTVPVHPRLRGLLRPLRSPYVWLFPGERRLHVCAATVWSWVRTVAEEAGVADRVTPHQLRHTIVNKVLKVAAAQGKDATVAQRFAGHARLETTRTYFDGASDVDVADVLGSIDWLGPSGEAEAA